jgi:hypothetical protein
LIQLRFSLSFAIAAISVLPYFRFHLQSATPAFLQLADFASH